MNAKDTIRYTMGLGAGMLQNGLADFSDAELLVRPVPNANHFAWQLGHLIAAEAHFHQFFPKSSPTALPEGFAAKHTKETSGLDTGYSTKAVYLDLFAKVRAETLAALDKMTDADLAGPNTGPLAQFAPTVADLLMLTATHVIMHFGQLSVVRRKLSKPHLF